VRSEQERSRPAARTGGRDQQAISLSLPVPVRGRRRADGASKQRRGTVPRQHFPATQTDTRSVEFASGFCTVNKEDAYGVKQSRAGSRQQAEEACTPLPLLVVGRTAVSQADPKDQRNCRADWRTDQPFFRRLAAIVADGPEGASDQRPVTNRDWVLVEMEARRGRAAGSDRRCDCRLPAARCRLPLKRQDVSE